MAIDAATRAFVLNSAEMVGEDIDDVFGLRCGNAEANMFRLDLHRGGALLLKIIPSHRYGSAAYSEGLAAWLADRSAFVPRPIAGFPRRLPDGRGAVLAPYFEGRRAEAREGDLEAIGRALGRIHRLLGEHPDRSSWARRTAQRLADLDETRAALARRELMVGPDPDRLAFLAADSELDFAPPGFAVRPLHGDFNPGNVLMTDAGAVVLDFEDVPHSVLPARFELALAIERFVLIPEDKDARMIALASALLRGYSDETTASDAACGDLVNVLRALSLRSLCVLAFGAASGFAVSDGEWRKFFQLENMARTRTTVLRAIEESEATSS